MRPRLALACALMLAFIAFVGVRSGVADQLWPKGSEEVTQLTPERRLSLQALHAEKKFEPNDYPPLGYTGAATEEDAATASEAVNEAISAILIHPDGPLKAKDVSAQIARSMRKVDALETEDRDRTAGYLVEVWYVLGLKGATGHFAYGSAFPRPPGYGEPLPPGWTAPDKPRPIPRAG